MSKKKVLRLKLTEIIHRLLKFAIFKNVGPYILITVGMGFYVTQNIIYKPWFKNRGEILAIVCLPYVRRHCPWALHF